MAPGMFPDVSWPMVRAAAAMLVPATAVVTTTERTFVIRVTGGKAEWVTVKKGAGPAIWSRCSARSNPAMWSSSAAPTRFAMGR